MGLFRMRLAVQLGVAMLVLRSVVGVGVGCCRPGGTCHPRFVGVRVRMMMEMGVPMLMGMGVTVHHVTVPVEVRVLVVVRMRVFMIVLVIVPLLARMRMLMLSMRVLVGESLPVGHAELHSRTVQWYGTRIDRGDQRSGPEWQGVLRDPGSP